MQAELLPERGVPEKHPEAAGRLGSALGFPGGRSGEAPPEVGFAQGSLPRLCLSGPLFPLPGLPLEASPPGR